MLFNSFEYLIFLPIVFLLYWFVFDSALSKCKYQLLLQNLFVVIASYIFYGWWDWRFLILIAISTILSFLSGLGIEYAPTQGGNVAMARAALQELGYSPAEIQNALKGADASASTEELIRQALRAMVMKG